MRKSIGQELSLIHIQAITVWNTLGHERNDLVELSAFNGSALTDGVDVYPVQKTADGAVAYVKRIPSKGYVVLRSAEAAPEKETFRIEERPAGGFCLETPFYEIAINDQGDVYKRQTDNSAMESINGWIKAELFMDFHVTGERPVYEEVNEYIKFFNEERPAYALSYLTPKQYRERYAA